eukprot:m.167150 g.167150  ORF g.167150 m.167150 type:complete len:102 (-) comp18185_c0_seq3:865-1170(-)
MPSYLEYCDQSVLTTEVSECSTNRFRSEYVLFCNILQQMQNPHLNVLTEMDKKFYGGVPDAFSAGNPTPIGDFAAEITNRVEGATHEEKVGSACVQVYGTT